MSTVPFKLACLGAAICMLIEGIMTWPTPFDRQRDEVAEIIRDHESGLIEERSLHNILCAMGHKEE